MKYLFYIGHPAHYHNFKNVSKNLFQQGNEIIWVVREKDVLFQLVEEKDYQIYFIKEKAPKSKWQRIQRILKREIKMLQIMLKHRPDLSIGTDLVITHIGKLLNISSIIVNEDDAEAVPLFASMGMKYATHILAPESCSVGPYGHKSTLYKGYQELAYLHPNYFQADQGKVKKLYGDKNRFFLIRFASLTAHHDDGVQGITDELARKIIEILEPQGTIWITSERRLSEDFERYRIMIPPKEIHYALAFADLYIGDSQTMAAEAAVLGTPSLRFNDFVGKLGYLEELEHKYGLTFGIPTSQPELLLEKVTYFAQLDKLKDKWAKKREEMLNSTIDVTAFWTEYFLKFANKSK